MRSCAAGTAASASAARRPQTVPARTAKRTTRCSASASKRYSTPIAPRASGECSKGVARTPTVVKPAARASGRVSGLPSSGAWSSTIGPFTPGFVADTHLASQLAEIGGNDYAASGSLGIQDQLAALRWVRDNVAAFGGDPARVTIAGESAGGMSVGILLGVAGSSGLFRGAIPQSGAAHHVSSRKNGALTAARFAQALGAGSISELLAAPVERVLAAQGEVEKLARDGELEDESGIRGMPFLPVVDGGAIPEAPLAAVRAGKARGVDVLVGTNADEMTLFGLPDVDDERLSRIAARHFPDAPRAIAAYRADHPGATPQQLALAISTDHVFRIPAVRLAEAQSAAGARVWKYLFTWRSRAFGGRLGATHALEIPFAFNTLDRPGVDGMLGPGPRPDALAQRMHAAWTSFVKTGDPACAETGAWSCYEPRAREVMEFGERVGALRDPGAATRALWDGAR